MGRKIPGKKHRTIKDPYKQSQKRLESVRLKINNPPYNADEQEISKSLLKVMELKNKTKQEINQKRKRRRKSKKPIVLSVAKLIDKEPVCSGKTKPDPFIPNLVQKPNETASSFLRRINSMTQILINEVEFERKFGVKIKKDSETGKVLEVKSVKKNSKSKKKTLADKRKEKLKKKSESLRNVKDFNQLKDTVEFGEVVHRPPDLFKSKKEENAIQKPKYDNLLLNAALENSSIRIRPKNSPSNLEKEKIESDRKFIVEAYRRAKKK